MRHLKIVLIAMIAAACGEKTDSSSSQEAGGSLSGVPAGAAKEEFADSPGLFKVSVSDNNGSLSASGTYRNDKREGSWVEYHPSGLVKTITSYVDGKKEGVFAELNSSGQLLKRCTYHNDQREGEYKEYNYTTLKEERFYKAGKLEGTAKIFYPDGKVMEEGNYVNGLRDGISRWYDQEGKVTIEYEYKNGQLVKK